jgi:hypothetical protein
MDFERPARAVGDRSHPTLLIEDDAAPILLFFCQNVAVQAPARPLAERPCASHFGGRYRREGVDLSVGMRDGHADLLPVVLEDEDVLDPLALE